MEIVNNSFGWTIGIEKVEQNTRQILKDIDIVKQLNKFIIDSNFKLKASCRVFTVLGIDMESNQILLQEVTVL
ncbi:hypothetical protein [Clostridium tyrobutyricum]|uniref:hypothetical protein n=1 Tax=Clostridium tyrobutyricum TaxID=1519 RepID=UPI0010AB4645|nr:hypothetical protein [Clostridium tyrobutyricum]QCH27182.1 hypothetical protein EZN00_00776 [Clostridium tyrobutyricum]